MIVSMRLQYKQCLQDSVNDLNQVHALKREYIDTSSLVKKLITNAEAASLVSKIYIVASTTPYRERVTRKQLPTVRANLQSIATN